MNSQPYVTRSWTARTLPPGSVLAPGRAVIHGPLRVGDGVTDEAGLRQAIGG